MSELVNEDDGSDEEDEEELTLDEEFVDDDESSGDEYKGNTSSSQYSDDDSEAAEEVHMRASGYCQLSLVCCCGRGAVGTTLHANRPNKTTWRGGGPGVLLRPL